VAFRCLNVLREFDITDVDIEIRESSVTRSAGPKLLEPALIYDPTADVCSPLTHALGIPIAAQATSSGPHSPDATRAELLLPATNAPR